MSVFEHVVLFAQTKKLVQSCEGSSLGLRSIGFVEDLFKHDLSQSVQVHYI